MQSPTIVTHTVTASYPGIQCSLVTMVKESAKTKQAYQQCKRNSQLVWTGQSHTPQQIVTPIVNCPATAATPAVKANQFCKKAVCFVKKPTAVSRATTSAQKPTTLITAIDAKKENKYVTITTKEGDIAFIEDK